MDLRGSSFQALGLAKVPPPRKVTPRDNHRFPVSSPRIKLLISARGYVGGGLVGWPALLEVRAICSFFTSVSEQARL